VLLSPLSKGLITMAIYHRGKHFNSDSRARRLIGAVVNFIHECDNETYYRFSHELRAILDSIDVADINTLAYLQSLAQSTKYSK
jgi:hypothetical protein